ncbi:hypothetical protein [Nonomuraea sp. bgisy101]|uniref:hypothetical protein n=1 Tax=Nonomuraea sp. bgisy101 TaxID=3413784 RepID=UPI003D737924
MLRAAAQNLLAIAIVAVAMMICVKSLGAQLHLSLVWRTIAFVAIPLSIISLVFAIAALLFTGRYGSALRLESPAEVSARRRLVKTTLLKISSALLALSAVVVIATRCFAP